MAALSTDFGVLRQVQSATIQCLQALVIPNSRRAWQNMGIFCFEGPHIPFFSEGLWGVRSKFGARAYPGPQKYVK